MSAFCLILFIGVYSTTVVGHVLVFQSALIGVIVPKYETIVSTYEKYSYPSLDRQKCVCMPFHLCKTYVPPSDGMGLIDLRIKSGRCPSYLDVCCIETIPTSTENYIPSYTNSGEDYTHSHQEEVYEYSTKKPLVQNYTSETPINYVPPTNSIPIKPIEYETESPEENYNHNKVYSSWNKNGVGFKVINTIEGEAQYGEFPSMIAIFKKEVSINGETNLEFHCGGSLLEPNVIITAAHCVTNKDPSILVVRAGEWDLLREKELYPHQDRRVKNIVIHQDYYSGGLYNDIALIFTDKDFVLQKHIKNMYIGHDNDYDHSVTCFAIGWGKSASYNNYTILKNIRSEKDNEIGQYKFNILKKVELNIMNSEKCLEALRTTRLGSGFKLHDSFVCAGGEEGRDTCKGDGGGPLVCPDLRYPGNLLQVGIISWGINCGLAGIPGVYVDVSKFKNWIDEQITNNNNYR